MSLAGKFGNFEIKKTDRISKEDQQRGSGMVIAQRRIV